MRIRFFHVLSSLVIGLGGVAPALATAPSLAEQCRPPAGWFVPGGGGIDGLSLLTSMSNRSVVLLGERHTEAEHHRWQLETIQALHRHRQKNLVLAFEMFPRSVQPVLDQWVAGGLSESRFLREARWKEVWGVNPELYMPIFRYARDHGIAMRAVNVDHSFVRAVRKNGFGSVPAERREGVTQPAAASPAYEAWLRSIYSQHGSKHGAKHGSKQGDERDAFARFVQAQQTWDRAMAQGIADSLRQYPGALVVGVMGSGHIVHGYGVPSQLRDLGIEDVGTLLPWDDEAACEHLVAGSADAMYGLGATLGERRFAPLGISLMKARKLARPRSS